MKSSYQACKFHDYILKLATDESLRVQYPALSLLSETVSVFPASTAELERFQSPEYYQV